MKINLVNSFYRSKYLKSGLEFASKNGALFCEGTSFGLAAIRPLAIYLTPNTDKENKKLACTKSVVSSAIGFGVMLGVSTPIAKSIDKIDKNPSKYISDKTIDNLKEGGKKLTSSKPYQFITQLFRLGIRTVMSVPKSIITCALIPPVTALLFSNKTLKDNTKHYTGNNADDLKKGNSNKTEKHKLTNKKSLNFTGRCDCLTHNIAKMLENKSLQKFTNKYKDTNYPMHITALGDTVATATFAVQTLNSKKIDNKRKAPLINNSIIATGLSILSGYGLDKVLDKPTERFINKFKAVNKDYKNLDKCVEGIKIAKPVMILGGIYYCAIPLISTFFAERIPNAKQGKI